MSDYPLSPLPAVLRDGFWAPRLATNRRVTIPAVLRHCEECGRLENFRRAAERLAGGNPGPYVGSMPFDDTELYKAIEGASACLAGKADPAMQAGLEELASLIAAAQEPDGYLYTNRTIDPAHVHPFAGPARWSNLVMSHELYNCGHLYEAACAHHRATGSRTLLEVALRSAELVLATFGPAGRHDVPGHQIVEMGLASLYRLTGERRYLEAARFLLEGRGRHDHRPLYSYVGNPGYCQDHLPVRAQREAVGHAVRAVYMYCGMADLAALLPEPSYAEALQSIWQDMVESKLYLTGGIGARHEGEAFGEAFELPNRTAYAETCAAIGSVMWNHRLFRLTGEARFYDVLEQTLYNGVLSCVSLDGEQFFYPNPLESDGKFAFNHGSSGRRPWLEVSCCPTSLCRFLPTLPGYLYAEDGEDLYVNLFASSRALLEAGGTRFRIEQETEYPWSGAVRLRLHPDRPAALRLRIRLPGWSQERILGGGLYRFQRPTGEAGRPRLRLNGQPVEPVVEKGYAVLERRWEAGDRVELDLPMPVRKVLCDERVAENRGKAALQRGPLVYCVEGQDSAAPLEKLVLREEASLAASWDAGLLGGLVAIRGAGFRAIPYFAWANRGAGPMRVWLGGGR